MNEEMSFASDASSSVSIVFVFKSCLSLAIVTPGLLGPDYFREIGAILNTGGPLDVEKLKAVMLRNGLVPTCQKHRVVFVTKDS
jgi:hypothetical protein